MAVVAIACAGSDAPVLVPDTTTAPQTSTTTVPIETEVIRLTATEELPEAAPALVLATDRGVIRWTAADGPEVVQPEPVQRAVDDGQGGIVGLTVDDQLLASLRWWPAGGDEVLLRSQGGLTLHDATVRVDAPAVVIGYSPIDTPSPAQVLDILDLTTTSSRTVREVGDETAGMIDVGVSADGFVMTQADGSCADVIAFDDTGEDVDNDSLPTRTCEAPPIAYGPIGLADDGATAAVARVSKDDKPSVLISRSGTDELIEHPVDAAVDAIVDLDSSSTHVAIASGTTTVLIDLAGATVTDLGIAAHGVQIVPA